MQVRLSWHTPGEARAHKIDQYRLGFAVQVLLNPKPLNPKCEVCLWPFEGFGRPLGTGGARDTNLGVGITADSTLL